MIAMKQLCRPAVWLLVGALAGCSVPPLPPSAELAEAITSTQVANHIRILGSDEFQGRKPNTEGEEMTVRYISEEFKKLGLRPGVDGSFYQEVRLAEINPIAPPTLRIRGDNKELELAFKKDYIFYTNRLDSQIVVNEAEIVFVGYGIVAPEFRWNDYEGLDVAGKIVMVLANDPGLTDTTLFNGLNKTYYGLPEYKVAEARRHGAIGVITVFKYLGPGTAPWPFLQMLADQPDIILDEGKESLEFTLQIQDEPARKLLEMSGHGSFTWKEAATEGFRGFPLNAKTSFVLKTTSKRFTSRNVIGLLEGSRHPEEYIVYTAHWDHDGIRKPIDGDSIYNGAVDNASGVAMVIETARAFTKLKVRPERSIVFMALTAEELGLLGSAYYVEHPVFPLEKTLACINADASFPYGAMKLAANVVAGRCNLDTQVDSAARVLGRKVVPDPHPEFGAFFRSDHYNFVKKGVPSVYAVGLAEPFAGNDSVAMAGMQDYVQHKYHQVNDEFYEGFNSDGIALDAKMNFLIGYQLAYGAAFPEWNEKSEYRSIRKNARSK